MRVLVVLAAGILALPLLPTPALSASTPVDVPAGFVASELVAIAVPTSLDFGPDGDLYATTLTGDAQRIDLLWTPAGPVVTGIATVASGFAQPLGVAFADGAMFVSDSHTNPATGRPDGFITRIDESGSRIVVEGIPNGRHNTNHMRNGPDGRLYIANGNPNDNGRDGGNPDVFPYSGAILSVDAAEVSASPAILRWTDATGHVIPASQVASSPLNADFASKVHVLAHGFRNVFGVAFKDGIAYTAMNGADSPSSQDALFKIAPGADYGFPSCYDVGAAGAVGAGVTVGHNPIFPTRDCSTTPRATALLGWHVCATGIDAPTAGPFGFQGAFARSVYVGECTQFFPETQHIADGTYDTAHKVARVELDAGGNAVRVTDFLDGTILCTDVRFGPDGAMYVADAHGVIRVAQVAAVPP